LQGYAKKEIASLQRSLYDNSKPRIALSRLTFQMLLLFTSVNVIAIIRQQQSVVNLVTHKPSQLSVQTTQGSLTNPLAPPWALVLNEITPSTQSSDLTIKRRRPLTDIFGISQEDDVAMDSI
jgi:hypothetical protein